MSDTLTPERIAELRAKADEDCYKPDYPVPVRRSVLLVLLDAAEERATLRAERDESKERLSIELGWNSGAKGVITSLEAEVNRLRDLLARVKRVLPPGELYAEILSVLHEEAS